MRPFLAKFRPAVLVVGAALFIGGYVWAYQKPDPKKNPCPDGPVTENGILSFLSGAKRDRSDATRKKGSLRLPEMTIVREIDKCGISFVPTADSIDAFKKLDASDKLLGAIDHARKPPPPEPPPSVAPIEPPKPKEGRLAVTCKPVDCDVLLNGAKRGTTKKGVLSLGPLPVGPVKISVARKDYDPDRDAHNAVIRDNDVEKVDFLLKESRAALERTGEELFTRMIEALGGEAGIKEASRVRASGNLISARDGKPNQWSLLALIKLPSQAKFAVTRVGLRHEIVRTEAGFQWDKEPKEKGGEELEDALREFYDRQIGKTLEYVLAPGLKKTAAKLEFAAGAPQVFRIEGGADSYVVSLDSEFHPREVRLESQGLMSGLRILYADYVPVGKIPYPKATQVIFPGAAQQGVEFRIDTVELGAAAVKDTDVVPKKGWKALGKKK